MQIKILEGSSSSKLEQAKQKPEQSGFCFVCGIHQALRVSKSGWL